MNIQTNQLWNTTPPWRKAAEEIVLLGNNAGALPLAPDSKIALFGVTSYDFITGGTGAGNVNGSYVIDLGQGLSDAGFALDKTTDEFYADCMRYERFNTKRINSKFDQWFVDAERPAEALPSQDILTRPQRKPTRPSSPSDASSARGRTGSTSSATCCQPPR